MIPIHDISEAKKKAIRMNELVTLTHYDSSEPHRHNYFEFFVFLKGGGTHIIDFEEFEIKPFSIHIVAPGQVHQVKRELDSNGFVFLFELNQFDNSPAIESFLFDHICLDVHECSPVYIFETSFNVELEHLIKKTWEEYQSDDLLKNQLVHNHLSLLMLYCIRNKQNLVVETDHKNGAIYNSFRRILNKEFKQLKKVKDYANSLNITEKHLNEIIQQRTGETASSLIYKKLILEAKRLLNTGNSTKEVSYELNFMDPGHFSKFFKTQTGLSPTEFVNVHE